MPFLSKILIYPVKSLEPLSVEQIRVAPGGALEGDRALALFDAENKFINGKRNSRIHLLRSQFDSFTRTLRLGAAQTGLRIAFHIDRERAAMETWLSEFFGMPVQIRQNTEVGFPDDLDCPGPTVIGVSTLGEVASWFAPLDANQIRRRIRANLEISTAPAFWEDRLYAAKGTLVRFRIGEVLLDGNNPCQRCVVPPRDPMTAENFPNFSNIFMQRREQTLPPWAERSRFNHFYRLAVNTIVPTSEAGKTLRVGDEIEILG